MTTPAALVLALPAAPATSSSDDAASLAIMATSSSSAIRPDGMENPWGWRNCSLAKSARHGEEGNDTGALHLLHWRASGIDPKRPLAFRAKGPLPHGR